MIRIFFLTVTLTAAWGQALLTGPMSGYVFHSGARAICPIVGVPGGAYLGPAVASGFDVASASPDGRAVLAAREGSLWHFDPRSPAAAWALGDVPGVQRIAWNPSSKAAAIAVPGRILVFDGQGLRELGGVAGEVTALALDASADVVLASVSGDEAGLYVVNGGAARLVYRGEVVAFTFGPDNRDVFFAESGRGEILRLANVRDPGDVALFAAVAPDARLAGLALSADGATLLAVDRTSRSLRSFDVATGQARSTVELGFEPSGLERLSDSLLWLNPAAAEGAALQVLDSTGAVYFIPAGAAR